MKRMMTAILTAAALLMSTVPMTGHANEYPKEYYDRVEYGGLYYYISKDEKMPDQYVLGGVADKDAESFTIPQEIDGKKVNGIALYDGPEPIFTVCENLKEINIEGGRLGWWYTIDGVLFNDSQIRYYPRGREGDYTIPEGTKAIDPQAFWKANKLGKLTVCPGIECNCTFYECSLTEFDGTGMWGSGIGLNFANCPNLKTIHLEGKHVDFNNTPFESFHLEDLPALESLTFTPETTFWGTFVIKDCPKLHELKLPECVGVSELSVQNCEALEHLSFYNGFLGLSDKYVEYDLEDEHVRKRARSETVRIADCGALKDIDVLATPYVTSHDWMTLNNCPALERVAFHEMPASAMTGEAPDEDYVPMRTDFSTGDFTVAGREEHTVLKNWCEQNGHLFAALEEAPNMGDVDGDSVVNASDGAQVLIAAAITGSGGASPLTQAQQAAADVNGDGIVNASDAALIMQYSAAYGAGSFSGTITEYLEARNA